MHSALFRATTVNAVSGRWLKKAIASSRRAVLAGFGIFAISVSYTHLTLPTTAYV